MIYSPTCQHALRALLFLGQEDREAPVLVREIARESNVPRQTLSKILYDLQKKGLVASTRGPGGGYNLARPADQITLLEIVEAVDGNINLWDKCILGLDHCDDENGCALHDFWKGFREKYYGTISEMTLEEAAEALRLRSRREMG